MLMYIVLLFSTYAVKCSGNECLTDFQCNDGYCCRGRYIYEKKRCMAKGCIGQRCATNQHCGGVNECCRTNVCADCSDIGCQNNFECPFWEYCCRKNGYGGVCSYSCEKQFCRTNEDCGAPGECCVQNRCTTSGCQCRSNANCTFGEYCCNSDTGRTCNFSCIGKSCLLESDCGAPGEKCTYPDSDCWMSNLGKKCPVLPEAKCFNKNGCYSHKDCDVFGSGYYCCADSTYLSFGRSCNSNCLKKYCDKDGDCGGSSECCDSSNKCAKCPDKVAGWIIGVAVGISLLFIAVLGVVIRCILSKRKRQRMQALPPRTRVTANVDPNSRPENSYSATLERRSSFADDFQSFNPYENYPMSSRISKVGNEPGMSSNGSAEGHRNEEHETVLPSAPAMSYPPPSAPTMSQPPPSAPTMSYPPPSAPTGPYPVTPPSHPPPSYQELFANR